MEHRHLNGDTLSLAAIDDIIERSGRDAQHKHFRSGRGFAQKYHEAGRPTQTRPIGRFSYWPSGHDSLGSTSQA
jgi:hypothetical protein